MKYLLAGIFGGVLGGLGMGGGTLLIPVLSLMLGVEQIDAQLMNIIAFIPMAIVTVVINAKKKLIEWKYIIYVSLSGTITAIFSSFFVESVDKGVLRFMFGIFLIVIGTYSIISTVVKMIAKRRDKTLVDINITKADDTE